MLIENNEELLTFIPNVLKNVQGEKSLFDKMKGALLDAEALVHQYVCSMDVLESFEKSSKTVQDCKRICALTAYYNSLATMDLVLTPNGFGVVSNDTIAPASKERTKALAQYIVQQRDESLNITVQELRKNEQWRTSAVGQYWRKWLVQDLLYAKAVGATEKTFDFHLATEQKRTIFEDEIAEMAISHDIMDELRDKSQKDLLSPVEGSLVRLVVAMEIKYLKDEVLPICYDRVVNFIRRNLDTFTTWESSHAASLYQDDSYHNDKNKGGYWL